MQVSPTFFVSIIRILLLHGTLRVAGLTTPTNIEDVNQVGFLQGDDTESSFMKLSRGSEADADALSQSCVDMENKGVYFTIPVGIGTPPQNMDLVADTGSDSVLVTSCACVDSGQCDKEDTCFRGTDKSSTFKFDKKNAIGVKLVFGSGPVNAVSATDVVTVGGQRAVMEKNLLLMIAHDLNLHNAFSGILGLGMPLMHKSSLADVRTNQELAATGAAMVAADSASGDKQPIRRTSDEQEPESTSSGSPQPMSKEDRAKAQRKLEQVTRTGFLEKSGAAAFSMCAREKSGSFRANDIHRGTSLSSISSTRWSLSFNGITVGTKKTKPSQALFCTPQSRNKACMAIPDSGTTVMMGPTEHIELLYSNICDEWSRCRTEYSKQKKETANATKAGVFQELLLKCSEWGAKGNERFDQKVSSFADGPAGGGDQDDADAGEDEAKEVSPEEARKSKEKAAQTEISLDELPTLHMHLAGNKGEKERLRFDGNAYVLETVHEDMKYALETIKIFGKTLTAIEPQGTGKYQKICLPAFGSHNITLPHSNGQSLWILGTPLFYQYVVKYNLKSSPPSIGFGRENCGECNAHVGAAMATSAQAETHNHVQPALGVSASGEIGLDVIAGDGVDHESPRLKRPLQIRGPWRMPTWAKDR